MKRHNKIQWDIYSSEKTNHCKLTVRAVNALGGHKLVGLIQGQWNLGFDPVTQLRIDVIDRFGCKTLSSTHVCMEVQGQATVLLMEQGKVSQLVFQNRELLRTEWHGCLK